MDYHHISVNKILDSTNSGSRVTTFVLTYPRYIHAEFMTHRMFSRNAQSSRAIPCQKRIDKVRNDPVYPIRWGANQKGMQAKDTNVEDEEKCKELWSMAARVNCLHAHYLSGKGLHKQWTNRLLEPFDTITVIVTATEWENFFALRCAEDAQPEINHLAWMMAEQYYEGEPPEERTIHLPFISGEREKQCDYTADHLGPGPIATHVKIQVSAACCARVSYLNFDGEIDIQKDIALYGHLIESGHMTPMEHQCVATPGEQHANLRGWKSHRSMLPTDVMSFDYEQAKRKRNGG